MKILIIDDNDTNLKILSMILAKEPYEVRTLNTAESLMSNLTAGYDLILLDVNLPRKNGYEICREIKESELYHSVPVIFLSAECDTSEIVKGFAVGAADYITIPFNADEVRRRVAIQLKLQKLKGSIQAQTQDKQTDTENHVPNLAQLQMETIFSLAKLSQAKDDSSPKHLERVKRYCRVLAKQLMQNSKYANEIDNEFLKNIQIASVLHDIGKVGISSDILLKPAKLIEDEFNEMKKHTTLGYDSLNQVREKIGASAFINMGMEIARWHHERVDGNGYPDGLKADEIPVSAKIMALCDVYDALRSTKVYKASISHEKSVDIIKGGNGTQFDSDVVAAFKSVKEKFDAIWQDFAD